MKPRQQRGAIDRDVMFPVAPVATESPASYAEVLADLKQRIGQERLRVVMASNAAMVMLYWDIGQRILGKQSSEGWGARVIDRLSADLRETFPDMRGFSPRNLKYMRSFAAAWPEREIVQAPLAQLTWYHNLALLEKLGDAQQRLWYARQALAQGWSRNILAIQIDAGSMERQGNPTKNTRKHQRTNPDCSPSRTQLERSCLGRSAEQNTQWYSAPLARTPGQRTHPPRWLYQGGILGSSGWHRRHGGWDMGSKKPKIVIIPEPKNRMKERPCLN